MKMIKPETRTDKSVLNQQHGTRLTHNDDLTEKGGGPETCEFDQNGTGLVYTISIGELQRVHAKKTSDEGGR